MSPKDQLQAHPPGERRQFRRFPLQLTAKAKTEADKPADTDTVDIEVANFSLGGLRIRSQKPIEPNARVRVKMPPFGTRPQIDISGRVVHCVEEDQRFQLGIEFCQVSAEAEDSPWLRLHELFYLAGEHQNKKNSS